MPGAPVLTRHLLLAAVAAYADAVAAPWKSVSVEDFGALGDNHTGALYPTIVLLSNTALSPAEL